MKNKLGFTLLEVVVVIAIMGLTLPAVVSLFFASIRSQTKVLILQEVKRNGDSAFDTITTKLRNEVYSVYSDSSATTEVCSTRSSISTPTTGSSPLYFKTSDGTVFSFTLSDGAIIYTKGGVSTPLTTTKVTVPTFSITCARATSFSTPLVSIVFSVRHANSTTRSEEKANLDYQTKMKLRTY